MIRSSRKDSRPTLPAHLLKRAPECSSNYPIMDRKKPDSYILYHRIIFSQIIYTLQSKGPQQDQGAMLTRYMLRALVGRRWPESGDTLQSAANHVTGPPILVVDLDESSEGEHCGEKYRTDSDETSGDRGVVVAAPDMVRPPGEQQERRGDGKTDRGQSGAKPHEATNRLVGYRHKHDNEHEKRRCHYGADEHPQPDDREIHPPISHGGPSFFARNVRGQRHQGTTKCIHVNILYTIKVFM